MRVAGFVKESIVDGVGIRYVIFTQGCRHNCKGCHNKHTHDFNGGYSVDVEDIVEDIKKYKYLDGVTLSGGDPFYQAKECCKLLKILKNELNINIWCYTGFTYEELMGIKDKYILRMLKHIDVLVDGRYIESLRDLNLRFRGSRNQRLIDVRDSLERKSVVGYSLSN